jgi:hypothetical protein
LQFPRAEVAKMFFEEVTSYLTAHPRSIINDIRFVAYGGDQATVDAFLGLLSKNGYLYNKLVVLNVPFHYITNMSSKGVTSGMENSGIFKTMKRQWNILIT